MNRKLLSKDRIHHLLLAKDEYSLHSPLMFDFFTKGLKPGLDKTNYRCIRNFEKEITKKYNDGKISCSRSNNMFLCKLVRYFAPENILEVGTEFGISTQYMARTNHNATVFSIGNSEEKTSVADKGFRENGINNVKLFSGLYDQLLPECLEKMRRVDFACINKADNDDKIMRYIELILPYCSKECPIVIKGIYENEEMKKTWQEICEDKRFMICADFFSFGLILLSDKPLQKQNYRLKMR